MEAKSGTIDHNVHESHSISRTPTVCACCHMYMKPQSTQGCHSPKDLCCGNFCPDIAIEEIRQSGNEDQIYTPAIFHRRHSLLRQQSKQPQSEESLIESIVLPAPTLSEQELQERRQELAILERSQQEDDAIRLMMAAAKSEEGVPGEDSRIEDSARQ